MSKSHYDTAAMRCYKVAKVAYWRSRKASFSPIGIIRIRSAALLLRRPRRLSLGAP